MEFLMGRPSNQSLARISPCQDHPRFLKEKSDRRTYSNSIPITFSRFSVSVSPAQLVQAFVPSYLRASAHNSTIRVRVSNAKLSGGLSGRRSRFDMINLFCVVFGDFPPKRDVLGNTSTKQGQRMFCIPPIARASQCACSNLTVFNIQD